MFYGFLGSLICFISSIISSMLKCVDKTNFINIDFICKLNVDNSTIYYYDSYSFFVNNYLGNDKSVLVRFKYTVFLLLRITLSFLIKLFSILIIQKLNPVYYICAISIRYFVVELINDLVNWISKNDKDFRPYNFFNLLAELINILGTIYYLEIIEFNCCKLNYNLKKIF